MTNRVRTSSSLPVVCLSDNIMFNARCLCLLMVFVPDE